MCLSELIESSDLRVCGIVMKRKDCVEQCMDVSFGWRAGVSLAFGRAAKKRGDTKARPRRASSAGCARRTELYQRLKRALAHTSISLICVSLMFEVA